jgi:hypothetical protein
MYLINNGTNELYKQLFEIAYSGSNNVLNMISHFEEDLIGQRRLFIRGLPSIRWNTTNFTLILQWDL